jgi:hypothetical protein
MSGGFGVRSVPSGKIPRCGSCRNGQKSTSAPGVPLWRSLQFCSVSGVRVAFQAARNFIFVDRHAGARTMLSGIWLSLTRRHFWMTLSADWSPKERFHGAMLRRTLT